MEVQDFKTLLLNPEIKKTIENMVDAHLKYKASKENASSKDAAKRETRKK